MTETNMYSMTTRERLHVAASLAEQAASEVRIAQQHYDAARERLNILIDELCPLPEGEPVVKTVEVHVQNKISLIKLVRTATSMWAKQITNRTDAGCMGLKDAKDLVEKFIDTGGRLD